MGNIGSGRISGSTGGSGGGGGTSTAPFEQFNVLSKTSTFTVTEFAVSASNCKVFVDGILLPTENYTVLGNVITIAFDINEGSIVTITN